MSQNLGLIHGAVDKNVCMSVMQAGIASPEYPDQLLIALEPEAASIYVRRLRMHQLVPEKPERRPLSPRADDTHYPMNTDLVQDEFRDGIKLQSFVLDVMALILSMSAFAFTTYLTHIQILFPGPWSGLKVVSYLFKHEHKCLVFIKLWYKLGDISSSERHLTSKLI